MISAFRIGGHICSTLLLYPFKPCGVTAYNYLPKAMRTRLWRHHNSPAPFENEKFKTSSKATRPEVVKYHGCPNTEGQTRITQPTGLQAKGFFFVST